MPWLPVRQRWWRRWWWWWWRKRRGKIRQKEKREKGEEREKGRESKGGGRQKKGGEKRQKGRNWGTWRSVNEARVKNRNDDDDDDDTIHQHQQLVLVAMQVEQLRLLCIHWSHVHYSFSRDAAAPARVCVAPPIIDADPRLLVPGVRLPGRRRRAAAAPGSPWRKRPPRRAYTTYSANFTTTRNWVPPFIRRPTHDVCDRNKGCCRDSIALRRINLSCHFC